MSAPFPLAAHAEAPPKGPSNRSFGTTVGGILLVLGMFPILTKGHLPPFNQVLCFAGAILVLLGLLWPSALERANRAWMQLGAIMAQIANPIMLSLIFVVAFMPIALFMRLRGHDPLRRKRAPPGESYWVRRDPTSAADTLSNQF